MAFGLAFARLGFGRVGIFIGVDVIDGCVHANG